LNPENYAKILKEETETDMKRKEKLLAIKAKAMNLTKKEEEQSLVDLE